jgi:hypothetical protein
MWYRRITEIYEVEPPPPEPLPSPWKTKVQFGQNPFGRVTSELSPLKKRKVDEMDAESGLMDFKRIRLISRRKRVKRPPTFPTPFQVQTPTAWPTPLRSDGSAIQLNLNRASNIQSTQRAVSLPRGMNQQSAPSFQLTPELFERTRPPEAGSPTRHAGATSGIWTEAYRSVIEVEEEEEAEKGQEQEDKNEEDLEREDSFNTLNLRPGATLSEIRDAYRSLMWQNCLPLLHQDYPRMKKWARIRLAYEILAFFFLKDSNIPFLKNPATEEDARRAGILLGCSSTKDSSEDLFFLLNWAFDAHSLGEFIDAIGLIHYGPGTRGAREAGEIWLYLTELTGKMKWLKELVLSNTNSEQNDEGRLRDLLTYGERLFVQLRDLLDLCEDRILMGAEQDGNMEDSKVDKAADLKIIETLLESGQGRKARGTLIRDIHSWSLETDVFRDSIERSQLRGLRIQANEGKGKTRGRSPDFAVIPSSYPSNDKHFSNYIDDRHFSNYIDDGHFSNYIDDRHFENPLIERWLSS